MVADVIRETHDATTLLLFTGNDKLEYKPGHFLTIDPHQFEALERFIAYLEDAKGKKEPPRAYSLASAPHEKYLAITVKEERYVSGATQYPPLLSPLLVKRTAVGARMIATGFTGPYTMPGDIEERTDHLVHVCAGSGVVPNFSMIKSDLENGTKLRHTLIYSNNYWRDIIFRQQLKDLQASHPDRFKIVHALTRESEPQRHDPDVLKGRISADALRNLVNEPQPAEFFVCGPGITKWDKRRAKEDGTEAEPRFLESVLEALRGMDVPECKIHQESYG